MNDRNITYTQPSSILNLARAAAAAEHRRRGLRAGRETQPNHPLNSSPPPAPPAAPMLPFCHSPAAPTQRTATIQNNPAACYIWRPTDTAARNGSHLALRGNHRASPRPPRRQPPILSSLPQPRCRSLAAAASPPRLAAPAAAHPIFPASRQPR